MKKRQNLMRILAVVLALLIVGGTVASVLISALAEETVRDSFTLEMEYLEDQQALHISQRLVFHNDTGDVLDRVVFYAAANMYRRESALMYESSVLESVFPSGYAPAGIELGSVQVNGQDADWGYMGDNEMNLRVACDLQDGESCTFDFEYYLLLSENRSMIGIYETDVRLSAFYFIPCRYEDGDYYANSPLQFTRWLDSDPADYRVTLTLPDSYLAAATGSETLSNTQDHTSTWIFEAQNVREFAVSFGKRYRESSDETDSGVTVRVLSNHRSGSKSALKLAKELIAVYEAWFGEFPVKQIDLVQTDYPVDALNFPGVIWIPEDQWDNDSTLKKTLAFCLAQQYIGLAAYPQTVTDAWLSDVPCSYLALLAIEELDGYDAFLEALNDQVLDALKITVPGGLYITAEANVFTADEYALIVRDRGTAVMHELRVAMGRDAFIDSMAAFYRMGLQQDILGEYDLVAALDSTTGGDWEDFLTDWLFNISDYIDQELEYYE